MSQELIVKPQTEIAIHAKKQISCLYTECLLCLIKLLRKKKLFFLTR